MGNLVHFHLDPYYPLQCSTQQGYCWSLSDLPAPTFSFTALQLATDPSRAFLSTEASSNISHQHLKSFCLGFTFSMPHLTSLAILQQSTDVFPRMPNTHYSFGDLLICMQPTWTWHPSSCISQFCLLNISETSVSISLVPLFSSILSL